MYVVILTELSKKHI